MRKPHKLRQTPTGCLVGQVSFDSLYFSLPTSSARGKKKLKKIGTPLKDQTTEEIERLSPNGLRCPLHTPLNKCLVSHLFTHTLIKTPLPSHPMWGDCPGEREREREREKQLRWLAVMWREGLDILV